MSNFMYRASAPVFTHNLKNLSKLLKAAAAAAKAGGFEVQVLLNARLAPDMFPLVRQIQVATDNAKGCCARLSGETNPVFEDKETTIPELQERIKHTLAFIRSIKPARFEGSASREVVMKTPMGNLGFSGEDYLHGWALPNFYFHYSAAYNILRHNGVQLGKLDYLGPVPGMTMTGKLAKMMAGKTGARAKKKR